MKPNVIVFGKGTLAIRISEWFLRSDKYELAMVAPVIPEPTWTDSISQWAFKNGVPVIESGHYKDIPNVKDDKWEIDLAISVFYEKIIKEWFIKKCKRILNLHNSPLPKYRGVSPINWALKNGEIEHGVTIHEITPGIDDGPIVAQLKYSIYPDFEEVIDVYNKALLYGYLLFEQTMPVLDKIVARPQDESLAKYYSAKENHLLGEYRYFTKNENKSRS